MFNHRAMLKAGFKIILKIGGGEEYHHPWGHGFSPPELIETLPSELIVIPRGDFIEVTDVLPKEGLVHSSRGRLDFDRLVAGYGDIGIVTLTQTGDSLVYRVVVNGDQLSRAGGMLGDAVHFSLVPFLRDGMETFGDVAGSEKYGKYGNVRSLLKYDPEGGGSFVGFGASEYREASPRKTWAEWKRRVRKREREIPASLHDVDFKTASRGHVMNDCSVTYEGKTANGRGWASPMLGQDGLATAELNAYDLEGLDFDHLTVFVPMGQYRGSSNQLMRRRFGKIEEYKRGLVVPGQLNWDEIDAKLRDPSCLQVVAVKVADDHYDVQADGFSMRTNVQKCDECGRPYWHFGVIIGRTGLVYPFGSGTGGGYSHLSDHEKLICGRECAESYTAKQMTGHRIVTENQAREFALDYAREHDIKHNGSELTGFGKGWNAFYWVNFTRRTGPVSRAVGHVDFDLDGTVISDVRY